MAEEATSGDNLRAAGFGESREAQPFRGAHCVLADGGVIRGTAAQLRRRHGSEGQRRPKRARGAVERPERAGRANEEKQRFQELLSLGSPSGRPGSPLQRASCPLHPEPDEAFRNSNQRRATRKLTRASVSNTAAPQADKRETTCRVAGAIS